MSGGPVERIKDLAKRINDTKDRMLWFLEVIKKDQDRLIEETLENRRRIEALEPLARNLNSETNGVLEALMTRVAPINDRYSYPEETERYRKSNPEAALLQHLRSFIPSPNVLDIGANVGHLTEQLLSAGYRVFAFEPAPGTFDQLCNRFEGALGLKPVQMALGAKNEPMNLYSLYIQQSLKESFADNPGTYSTLVCHPVPAGMTYGNFVEVKVRSLKSLHESGDIPADVGIVCIDTEGGDLEVIKGMGSNKYSVIVTKFWDGSYPFSGGEYGLLVNTVARLRNRGYPWHIAIYRVFNGVNSTAPRFYCNIDQSVKHSWGNALFFRDYDAFREAVRWCSAMLPANQSFGA